MACKSVAGDWEFKLEIGTIDIFPKKPKKKKSQGRLSGGNADHVRDYEFDLMEGHLTYFTP